MNSTLAVADPVVQQMVWQAAVHASLVFTCCWIALLAGGRLGQAAIQPPAAPTPAQVLAGVHPWRGWSRLAGHTLVAGAVQALFLSLVHTNVAALSWPGALAALALAASTHAVLTRANLGDVGGPAALFVAAMAAAGVHTAARAASAIAVSGALVAGRLAVEYLRAAARAAHPAVQEVRR